MSITIKPNTYYKKYCTYRNLSWQQQVVLLLTDTKHVYEIAYKHIDEPIVKHDNKIMCMTIENWQEYINTHYTIIEEISKEDLFLELL